MAELLSADEARRVFLYDPESGLLSWRARPSVGVKVGDSAGSKRKDGYLGLKYRGQQYLAHRIAWLITYGSWPVQDVDHIDGNRSNNAIANLRDVSRAMNVQNVRAPRCSNEASGMLGVTKRGRKWQASIWAGGRRSYLGLFSAPEEAHAAYVQAKRQLHPGNTM
jgi:hypothetical protein